MNTDYQKKYLKYESKLNKLYKQFGGIVDIDITESDIINLLSNPKYPNLKYFIIGEAQIFKNDVIIKKAITELLQFLKENSSIYSKNNKLINYFGYGHMQYNLSPEEINKIDNAHVSPMTKMLLANLKNNYKLNLNEEDLIKLIDKYQYGVINLLRYIILGDSVLTFHKVQIGNNEYLIKLF